MKLIRQLGIFGGIKKVREGIFQQQQIVNIDFYFAFPGHDR